MTSFCVILMIVFASCVVPVRAAVQYIRPGDYLIGPTNSNGILTYTFGFQSIPSYAMLVNDNGALVEGQAPISLGPDPDTTFTNIHLWPLGVRNWYNGPATSGLLSISDFDRFISAKFESSLFVVPDYAGNASGPVDNLETVTFWYEAYFAIQFYDANGNYIDKETFSTGKLESSYTGNVEGSLPSVGDLMQLNIPDGCVYICPYINYRVWNSVGSTGWIYRVGTGTDNFSLIVKVDSVVQNSETMYQIQQQLGDLNDKADQTNQELGEVNDKLEQGNQTLDEMNGKADTLIEGTPEMQDEVDRYNGRLQDVSEEMDDFIDWEDGIFQDFQTTLNEAKETLEEFLLGQGNVWLKRMITPILSWGPISYTMLMLVAFVNLSVILFGR